MELFRSEGRYCFERFLGNGFSSSSPDKEIPRLIREVWDQSDYLVDPHTACAFKDLQDNRPSMILATAHPAKFPKVYEQAGMKVPANRCFGGVAAKTPRTYWLSVDSKSVRSFIEERTLRANG